MKNKNKNKAFNSLFQFICTCNQDAAGHKFSVYTCMAVSPKDPKVNILEVTQEAMIVLNHGFGSW